LKDSILGHGRAGHEIMISVRLSIVKADH
jgi:hypothetical protein